MTWEPLHTLPLPPRVIKNSGPGAKVHQSRPGAGTRRLLPQLLRAWLVEAVKGSLESDLKHMVAVYLLGSEAGLMG